MSTMNASDTNIVPQTAAVQKKFYSASKGAFNIQGPILKQSKYQKRALHKTS